jgi:hypothetical protein
VPFNGCANHADRGLDGNPWCYVAGGTACMAAHADASVPGSAWKPCSDPNCQCVEPTASSTVELSGAVHIQVSERGCADHDGRGYEWCWVKRGTGCATATPATDPSMRTAAWQKCSASACDCATGHSDLPDKAVPLGCARHFAKGDDGTSLPFGIAMSAEVCYVKGGVGCSRDARSDLVIPDTAWRFCDTDCYALGKSFAPETRVACSCFKETKPGTLRGALRCTKLCTSCLLEHVHSRLRFEIPRLADRFEKRKKISIYNSHNIAAQMLKVIIEEVFLPEGRAWLACGIIIRPALDVLQKLGIPTEISTNYLTFHDNPIDDMADAEGLGSSIHILPGVNKELYGAALLHAYHGKQVAAFSTACS